jgi:hypothetical protein
MAKMARIDERLAELAMGFAQELARALADRAAVAREIAGDEPIDLGTGCKVPTRKEPVIPEPTEIDRARARKALQSNRIARKVRT